MNPAAGKSPIAALALALMLMGSLMPAPLLELYHRTWNLSPAQISVVFAVYAASVIPALIFLGGISDVIGRRRTILITFALLAIAALVFAFARGFSWLILARMIQGLAMGIGIGAATAAIREWTSEDKRERAGLVAVIAVATGSALGALVGGALGEYAPYPLALPYLAYIVLLAVGAVLVARVPKCPHVVPSAHRNVVSIPATIRRPFALAAAEAFLGWSIFAIFTGLVPSYLARTLDLRNLLIGGWVVAGLQIGSVLASIAGSRLSDRAAILTSMVALGVGIWTLQIGVVIHSYLTIAVSVFIAGAGGGLSYLAGLNITGAIAPPDHRAEMLSAFAAACYLGFSVPALAIGVAASRFGLTSAFAGVSIVLGAIALVVVILATKRDFAVRGN
jgi:MFS family permease